MARPRKPARYKTRADAVQVEIVDELEVVFQDGTGDFDVEAIANEVLVFDVSRYDPGKDKLKSQPGWSIKPEYDRSPDGRDRFWSEAVTRIGLIEAHSRFNQRVR